MASKLCKLCLGFSIAAATSAPSCKDDSGNDIDFSYYFKYPDGWDYAYMDSDTKLVQSSNKLNTGASGVSEIVKQMHSADVSHVLWNDQPPPDKDSSAPKAHAKGLLIFSNTGGVWLTHSLPHFPTTTGNGWASGAENYGQSFLCITVDADEINKLVPVLTINEPVVYSTKWATGAKDKFPDLVALADGSGTASEDMTAKVTIKSKGGQTFTLFGKSGKWGKKKDLYSDLVAPVTGSLDMEGWRHGTGVWGPACGADQVLDITDVSFPGDEWSTSKDHSKWAVAQTGTAFCVGDINRADGQDARGGGTVCIHDSSLASQMRKVIKTTDKCSLDIVHV